MPEIGAKLLMVTNLGSSIFRPVGGFSSEVLENDGDRLILDSSRFFSEDLFLVQFGLGNFDDVSAPLERLLL